MKVKGKRYEIVAYPNKVQEWRNGTETDLDEVLQVHTVFTNASRGILASARQLQRAFQTDSHDVNTYLHCFLEFLKKTNSYLRAVKK